MMINEGVWGVMMGLRNMWMLFFAMLIFFMIWASGELIDFKILLCIIIILIGVTRNILDGQVKISQNVIYWLLAYETANLFWLILSFAYGNSGALIYINVEIIEPILLVTIICFIREWELKKIKYLFVYISLFIYVYNIVGFMAINSFLPIGSLPFIKSDFGGVLLLGVMKTSAQYIQWLYFLIPANIVLYFYRNELYEKRLVKLVKINFVLSYITVFIVLKTAMILLVFFTTLFCFFKYEKFSRTLNIKVAIKAALVIMLMIIIMFFGAGDVIYDSIVLKVLVSIGSVEYVNAYGLSDGGASIRMEQIADLITTWEMNPILGWGTGANSLHVIRSSVNGTYEATYVAMLMQRGVLGIIIYITLVGWLFKKLIYYVKKNIYKMESVYIMAGLSGMLFGNATNPMLGSFDRLIILFLPLMIINVYTNRRSVYG